MSKKEVAGTERRCEELRSKLFSATLGVMRNAKAKQLIQSKYSIERLNHHPSPNNLLFLTLVTNKLLGWFFDDGAQDDDGFIDAGLAKLPDRRGNLESNPVPL